MQEDAPQAAPFFALRTSLLPFDDFAEWASGPGSPGGAMDPMGAGPELEGRIAADRRRLRDRLRAKVLAPLFREALFLASPDLEDALPVWLADPEGEKGQRIERTLVKYFARACGRATPFGLFAGCSVGWTGTTTCLATAPRDDYQRHSRLDMDYLCSLTESLEKDPGVRRHLVFRPNSSLYPTAGKLRYAEARQGKRRSYNLVAVHAPAYLLDTLAAAEHGASLGDLAARLLEAETDASEEEAIGFLQDLVDSQILVSDLQPTVTGNEPIHELIGHLAHIPAAAETTRRLEATRRALADLDAGPLGAAPDRYRTLAKGLEVLPAKVDLSRLFQVDLSKPAPLASLGGEVLDELDRGIQLLHGLRRPPAKDALDAFRNAFLARYDSRDVPLTEALDEEAGVGFEGVAGPGSETSPLLEGLGFPPGGPEDGHHPWGEREAFLLRKLQDLARTGGNVLRLAPGELEGLFQKHREPLPGSFSVIASLAASSQEAIAKGEFQLFLGGMTGPSGATLLGRFCHGDENLQREVRAHLEREEALRPEAVFAEIVHLPEGRVGNVILRPLLRTLEIPFLGHSGAREADQIPVSDLLVSVKGGRVVLRSRRLDREVIPRLTTAHNFSLRSLGLYRFLCMLQYQGVASGCSWNWGVLDSADFLPRVETGRLVLSKARWRVRKAELTKALAAKGAARFLAIGAWRRERGIPRRVMLADGDNALLLDLDNVMCQDVFLDFAAKREGIALEEMFPRGEDLAASGPEGRFVHELIVPYLSPGKPGERTGKLPPPPGGRRPHPQDLVRCFPPGSEWLYAKLYLGPTGADRALTERIAPLVRGLLKDGLIDQWFFIRFHDPEGHLRLRFHGEPGRMAGEVLTRLHAAAEPLMRDGTLWKMQLDTYEREVERYGPGEAMLLAERLFHVDSEAALSILEAFPGEAGADVRWRVCLRGMDMLLEDFGLQLEARHALVDRVRMGFAQEFGDSGDLDHQLGNRFRRERASLEALLDPTKEETLGMGPGIRALRLRSSALVPIKERLLSLEGAPQLTDLVPSFLHMHANRLLRSSARAHERVLYEFLARLYKSRLVRGARPAPVVEMPGVRGREPA